MNWKSEISYWIGIVVLTYGGLLLCLVTRSKFVLISFIILVGLVIFFLASYSNYRKHKRQKEDNDQKD